jgi:isopentenyl diphosphate isomerase/L-lactate dehydrogenase-like FMN-dependent dehydrogenase
MDIKRRDFIAKGSLVTAAATAATTGVGTLVAQAQTRGGPPAAAAAPTFAPDGRPDGVHKINIINLLDLQDEAQKVLNNASFTYIASGSGGEWTRDENRAAYDRVQILPQPLSGVGDVDLSVTLLGQKMSLPVFIPPMGGQGQGHVTAEVGTSTGAYGARTLMITSHVSNSPLEDIAKANPGPKFFQLYFPNDLGYAREVLHRAKDAGYNAIVATVDDQVAYPREQNAKARGVVSTVSINPGPAPGSGRPVLTQGNRPIAITDRAAAAAAMSKKVNITLDDLVWIKKETGLPVVVKGVVSPKVANAAIARGIDAIYISNHGGRSLDTVPGTLTQLPRVAEVVKGRVPIMFDGGIRRGTDVFKALALGATVVGCGRPVFFGLAVGGSLGVQSVIDYLRETLTISMQLAGTRDVKAITREYLTHV